MKKAPIQYRLHEVATKLPESYTDWSNTAHRNLYDKMSGGNEMIKCPYNEAHVILKARMASHLIKCRHQHKVEKYETCPFNTTHHVPVLEFQYHLKVCSDRGLLEKNLYILDEPSPERQENDFHIDLPESSENWDEEVHPGVSYLQVKDIEMEKQPVFRLPVGMTKSERKEFFQSEAERFEQALNEFPYDSH